MIHACLTVPLDILQAVFMHRERAVKFWIERNNMDRKSALEMWDSEVLAAKHKDQNGPQDSKLRIPVKLDDFLIVEDAEIYEKEKLLEHKRMKFSEEQGMLMDEGLEAGRAAAPADMARLGVGHLENVSLLGSVFGRRTPLPDAAAAFKDNTGGPTEDKPENKPKAKTFDVGLERLAMKDKLLTGLDKEIQMLQGVINNADAIVKDAAFMSALNDTATPTHELQAMKMIEDRLTVSEALIGSYKPGKTNVTQHAADQDAQTLAQYLTTLPVELPDIFKTVYPVSFVVVQLLTEIDKICDHQGRKELELEFKPIVNVVAIMRTSLKASLDKYVKFGKERASLAARQKQAEEQKEVKRLQQEKKKRDAQEQKLNKAAEKQGRVGDIFGIDLVKLQVKCMDVLRFEEIGSVDWTQPFIAKLDDASSSFPAVQSMLRDGTVTAALQSFYTGFPGSQAALQGSRRFTSPLKMTQVLRSNVVKELGIENEVLPEGPPSP